MCSVTPEGSSLLSFVSKVLHADAAKASVCAWSELGQQGHGALGLCALSSWGRVLQQGWEAALGMEIPSCHLLRHRE